MAGKILPIVKANSDRAFAAEITRVLPTPTEGMDSWNLENYVGAALRYLEKEGMVTSKKIPHPDGHPSHVRMYTLTTKGAFTASLVSR